MGRRQMTEMERAECIRLYGLGLTLDQLASVYDRHRTVIDRLVGRRTERRGHKFQKKESIENGIACRS